MYFSSKMEIDPSQITLIKKVKPSKLFGKLLDMLTFGAVTDKQEHETFTAISVLQQINMALRSINIHNVIRLSVDDYDFYLDELGVEDDLDKAMLTFSTKADPIESELFSQLFLALEHLENSIKYLIEIKISRKHKVGEYPININVNAVLADFKTDNPDSIDDVQNKINNIFSSQENYDLYTNTKWSEFINFIDNLELALKKYIQVDNVIKSTNKNIIRPKTKVSKIDEIPHERYAQPVFYGYYGIDNYLLYTYLWSSALYQNNIYLNDAYIVDSIGADVMSIGDNGFYAGDNNTLNTDAPFEVPTTGDLQYFPDNDYSDILSSQDLIDTSSGSDGLFDTTSWLDTGTSDFDVDSSCSSCSSCGSCSSN